MEVWEHELANDADSDFLLEGIKQGFHIVSRFDFHPAECENYSSALNLPVRALVEQQIKTELQEGRYQIVHEKPVIVSALGAISKPNGGIRLIHDASRPTGLALNDYAQLELNLKFQSLADAEKLVKPGIYMCKIDLKSAYRSVGVHPDDYVVTGLKWHFSGDASPTYMIDKRLPFGSRLAPGVFHRLTQAVRGMMATRGFKNLVVYLDDFLLLENSKERCLQGQSILIGLLRRLGFAIAWDKIVCPSQNVVFLGVEIDSTAGTFTLPDNKVREFRALIDTALQCKRWSLRLLQRLAGKLNWASSVVRGGRVYLRRILDLMRPLKHNRHKLRASSGMLADLRWWRKFLVRFNGKRVIFRPRRTFVAAVDACTTGGGIVFQDDWQYINWGQDFPYLSSCHINVKETAASLLALKRWAPLWSDSQVVIWSDNQTAVACINKGSSKSSEIMALLREIFWLTELYNIRLSCRYLRGSWNCLADSISRLNEPGHLLTLQSSMCLALNVLKLIWPYYFALHMSYKSFLFLVPQILRWLKPFPN